MTSTSTLDDNQIQQLSLDILNNPTTTIDSPSGKRLYSWKQMMQMFRRGYSTNVQATLTEEEQSRMKPYSILKQMRVGESVFLKYEQWTSARIAASQLKKQFGTEFHVSKMSEWGANSGKIKVFRFS